jgi:hypothetical protein
MYALRRKREPFSKETGIVAGIVFFYTIYSFIIKSNIPVAIFSDLLVQLKPFIAFFMMGYIGFVLSDGQKQILRKICLLLFFITAMIGIISLLSGYKVLFFVFGHPTRYGTSLVLIGLTYLFCSGGFHNKKDVSIFIAIITFSLISLKAKIFGFYGVAIFLILVLRGDIEIKFSVKNIVIATCLVAIAAYLAWDKLYFYFFNSDIDEKESLARPLLYMTSGQILLDYFPFGSGLASFATHYSGIYYSHIYTDYNMDLIWGLIEGDTAFAADTQYPSVAQYGIVGFGFFIIFWTRIVLKTNMLKKNSDNKNFMIAVLIMLFLAIESVADAAFTGNRGFYCMILLSLALNNNKGIENENPDYISQSRS